MLQCNLALLPLVMTNRLIKMRKRPNKYAIAAQKEMGRYRERDRDSIRYNDVN